MVQKSDISIKVSGGLAMFEMDDGYCWGRPSILFPASQVFSSDIREHCNLELEVTKSECFTWFRQLPVGAPQGLKPAEKEVGGSKEVGAWLAHIWLSSRQ